MGRLIEHAGTPKTGTTSIQTALNQDSRRLRKSGIVYPLPKPLYRGNKRIYENHRRVAMAIGTGDALTDELHLAFRERVAALLSNGKTVLISAEAIYRIDAVDEEDVLPDTPMEVHLERRIRYLEALSSYFDGMNPEFWLYFRRPDKFLISSFNETAGMSGMDLSFPDYERKLRFRTDYRQQIDLLQKYFPLQIRCFEDEVERGLIPRFYEELGAEFTPSNPPHVRRSLSPAGTLWLSRHTQDGDKRRGKRRRRWLFAVQHEAKSLFRTDEEVSFWESTEARDAFLTPRLEAVPELSFPKAPDEEPPCCVWSDDDHARANEAFEVWEKDHIKWLIQREVAGIPPFVDPQRTDTAM